MVDVALVRNIGVDREDDLGLDVSDCNCDGGSEVLDLVESAVGEAQKVHVGDTQALCAFKALGLSDVDKFLGCGAFGCEVQTIAAVQADEK